MNIYEILEQDHQTVLGLLDSLVATDDLKESEKLINKIASELIPHSRAEEAVLYNSIRDISTASEVVAHSYGEHMKAEALLRSLQVTGAIKVNWTEGGKKLKEALSHHIQEEQTKVFSAAKKLFTEEEAVSMGEVFNKLKPIIEEQSVLGQSMEMLKNLMPSRLRDKFSVLSTESKIS